MALEQFDRSFRTVVPYDPADPPRSGQAIETLVDVLVAGIQTFFTQAALPTGRITEVPTIRKYMRRPTAGLDYATVVEVLRDNPGVFETLPHVVIWVSDTTQLPIAIGPPYLATIQDTPRIRAGLPGPYAFTTSDHLVFRVQTPTDDTSVVETISIFASAFPAVGAVTAQQLVDEINQVADRVAAQVATVGVTTYVEFMPTGGTPAFIEVDPGMTANARTVLGLGLLAGTGDAITAPTGSGAVFTQTLTDAAAAYPTAVVGRYVTVAGATASDNNGRWLVTARPSATSITYQSTQFGAADPAFAGSWFIGERDDHLNTARPPMHRMAMRDLCGVSIEIVAEDPNTRTELADLVHSYVTFFWEREYFNYQGRGPSATTGAAVDAPIENFQAILATPVRRGGRFEVNRPDDQSDKVWVETLSFQTTIEQYIDRPVLDQNGANWFVAETDLVPSTAFDGDD